MAIEQFRRAFDTLANELAEEGNETAARLCRDALANLNTLLDRDVARLAVLLESPRLAALESAVADVAALNRGFHAVKQIRAHAAEENQRTKLAIANRLAPFVVHRVAPSSYAAGSPEAEQAGRKDKRIACALGLTRPAVLESGK